jgi:hypothetical protein
VSTERDGDVELVRFVAENLTAFAGEHPEVDIRNITPNAENIKKVLERIEK